MMSTENSILELTQRVEQLEIELKKEKLRCNNFQIIAQHAIRDKRILAGQFASLRKEKATHKKFNKLSNDDVMQQLRKFSFPHIT